MSRAPMSVTQRDRLRREHQRERELTERVLAAQRQLATAETRRAAVIAGADARVAASAERLADALVAYIDDAGVLPSRAAAVLGLPESAVVGMVRGRRATARRRRSQGLSNQRLEADAEDIGGETGRISDRR